MSTRVPNRVTAEIVLNALRECLADDDIQRDALGGGLPPIAIAEYLDRSKSSVRKRFVELRECGRVVKVQGVNPTGKPRVSYLPADHPDADGGSVPGAKS